jgi:hypothetical protein
MDVANMLTGEVPNANVATVGVAKGGTGLTSGTSGQFLKFTGSTTLASASSGITEYDNWRLSSSVTTSGDTVLTSNWERVDSSTFEKIGTGLSESSGVFSFPSTGKWQIIWMPSFLLSNAYSRHSVADIQVTTDNSNFNLVSRANCNNWNNTSDVHHKGITQYLFDVTDVSNYKFRFQCNGSSNSGNQNVTVWGDSNYNYTEFTCMKIGDT